ncbi:acyl-CoA thioesterase II [Jatrophihabitans endophyticus]|uniref:acyl-CoA thioesterase n=1 Tax=Jatrophihabitans endophyticus TaxID=1206085 RepID=UPI0019E85C61|nr:acyl-CoA thioesterase domain-containing protein [Jatrophihabitans endophyticus]MBE7188970.1 thioesterase family protein [Jatrophihabitans endophyticus]
MTDLHRLLELEAVEKDLYRANTVFDDEFDLYGGQVAAQALLAAGCTVDPDRLPHSLHGYFLRPGESARPTVFKVHRDRDGRSFSARRVVAIQRGEVVFNMAASFHVERESFAEQDVPMPDTASPEEAEPGELPRLFSVSARFPAQPFDGRARWPTRFWSKVDERLEGAAPVTEALLHACALTYLSDISTGVLPAPDGRSGPGASIDHAVWFHRPADMNDWVLSEYVPRMSGRGRGWYTGSIFARDGQLLASIAQECLFRPWPR